MCIIGKMSSAANIAGGIIADACGKPPKVRFKYLKKVRGLAEHPKSCSWPVSNLENNYAPRPSY